MLLVQRQHLHRPWVRCDVSEIDDAVAPHPILPFRNHTWPAAAYESIDAGIRFAVRVLHAAGIETCQSCEGGDGHAYDHPTVDLLAGSSDGDGFAALAVLHTYGLPVDRIAIVWNIKDGTPYEKLWRITFNGPLHARADDLPMFVQHYRYNVDLYERDEAASASGSRPEGGAT